MTEVVTAFWLVVAACITAGYVDTAPCHPRHMSACRAAKDIESGACQPEKLRQCEEVRAKLAAVDPERCLASDVPNGPFTRLHDCEETRFKLPNQADYLCKVMTR